MTTTKFHKTFGQIEIIAADAQTTTIVICATGEQKKLLNQFADSFISDTPFVKVPAKKATSKVVLSKEEELNLEYCNRDGAIDIYEQSKNNYRAGRYGASKL